MPELRIDTGELVHLELQMQQNGAVHPIGFRNCQKEKARIRIRVIGAPELFRLRYSRLFGGPRKRAT